MFYKLSERFTEELEKQRVILSEDREIYRFGIQQGLNLVLNLLTTIAIGLLCGMLWESVLFMLFYMPLRRYAGGYHAKTHLRCYLYSVLMITMVLLAIKFLPLGKFICSCLMLAGGIVIVLFAPIEDANKPLDGVEQRIFRKRTWSILFIESCFFIFSLVVQLKMCYGTISFAIISLASLVMIGKIKNAVQNEKL
ncbi:MAG: accessory gene regulator B family protein [Oscillospiraceae bacterium]|nr:accessory gene regulator B family protein [Oscillospiraceae bacterium]